MKDRDSREEDEDKQERGSRFEGQGRVEVGSRFKGTGGEDRCSTRNSGSREEEDR